MAAMGALKEFLPEGIEKMTTSVKYHHRVLAAVHNEYPVGSVYRDIADIYK